MPAQTELGPSEEPRPRVHPFLRAVEWPAVVGLSVLAFGLGAVGWSQYAITTQTHWTVRKPIYRALQLFTFEGGAIDNAAQMNGASAVARFLAPALTVYAAAKAALAALAEQLDRLNVRWWVLDHVVICGLGGIGYRLARRCRSIGLSMVCDDAARRHPDLVPWDQLQEASQQFTRYSCRRIPLIVAEFDYEIFRVSAGPTDEATNSNQIR